MPRLTTRRLDQLEPATREALAPVLARGPLAEVWLQFANGEPALRAYLGMEAALVAGSLSAAEVEAVKLLASELNACRHCIGVHSAKARAAGIDTAAQRRLRGGESIGDARLDAMLAIVRAFFAHPGPTPQALIDAARAVDVSDQNLVDLAMATSTIFFTNILNHVNDT